MKNVKNTLFVVTAVLAAGFLAALCSGCDGTGSGEVVEGGDAGRADVLAGKADVVNSSDSKVTPCSVPTPRLSLGGLVTTTPRDGYRNLEYAERMTCAALIPTGGMVIPTDCADPVDGFAKAASDSWYCVYTQKSGNLYYLSGYGLVSYGSGEDFMKTAPGTTDKIPGGVALCSTSGKFLGWDCNTTTR